MSQFSEKLYTAKEFIAFVNKEQSGNPLLRFELIDGYIHSMSSPTVKHQRIVGFILDKLSRYFDGKPCEAFVSPLDVYLFNKKTEKNKNNSSNVYQPDVFVVCEKKKIKSDNIAGAPELIVEVISQSTSANDYIYKLYNYMRYGVKEYWIVDHDQNQIIIYMNGDGQKKDFDMKAHKFNEIVKSNFFPGLQIDFTEFVMDEP